VATSASGSGQMQPLPMNEYIQQSLKSCFFNVDIKVVEWNTLFTNWRLGRKIPRRKGSMRSTSAPRLTIPISA
jgi:peptide/nickel transport system substrate-binding protein